MASANITAAIPTPLQGHVHLFLQKPASDSFHLEIPLSVIRNICLHPPKYLLYLGWCILGSERSLYKGGQPVNLDDELVDMGVYQYGPSAQEGLSYLSS